MAVSDEEIQEILKRAQARRAQLSLGTGDTSEIDPEAIGVGALQGATAAAATLPAVAEIARRITPEDLEYRAPGRGMDVIRAAPRNLPGGEPITRRNLIRGRGVKGRAAGLLTSAVQDLAETALRNPKLFATLEIAGGAGAGAASEASEEMGAGPLTSTAAGIAGGAAASTVPTASANLVTRAARWGMNHLVPVVGSLPLIRRIPGVAPMYESAARTRAARVLQSNSEDPAAAAEAALNGPEGVSPARRTGDERLLSVERRVLDDNPRMDREFREDLEAAAERAQGELADLYATPRGRQDWELALMQRVAADPEKVAPGTTSEMLDQAYSTFNAAYEPAKGFPILPYLMRTTRSTTLKTMLENVPETNRVDASEETRARVARSLKSLYSGFTRRLKNTDDGPLAMSDDYLSLRSKIRDAGREAARAGDRDRAALYRIAADKVTDVLKTQLPDDALSALRSADQKYAHYKVVEDAVYRAGDKPFSPDHLLSALKQSGTSKGAYARGAKGEMRALAQSGRDVNQLLNNPALAAKTVEGLGEPQKKAIRDDFVRTLMQKAHRTDDEGVERLSGPRFQAELTKYLRTARALGMGDDEIARLRRIASEISKIQRKSPEAVKELIEDGPTSVMQLLATLIGVHSGHRLGKGLQASTMVLSGFMAKRARAILDTLTRDKAVDILIEAHKDPKLYSALLTRVTDPASKKREAARLLNSYLIGLGTEEAVDKGDEGRAEAQRRLRDLRNQASVILAQ